jgi:hypothetical protein
LLILAAAFRNLRKLRRNSDLDVQTTLFVGGLHSSMVGFVIGALFAPVAYQFFSYFYVAYTSVLEATIKERDSVPGPFPVVKDWHSRYGIVRAPQKEIG